MKRMKLISSGLVKVAFFQAAGLALYITFIGWFMSNANQWMGPVRGLIGPMMFLTLFVTSALVCASMALGYPVILIWEKKQPRQAVGVVIGTAGWLVVFFGILVVSLGVVSIL